MKNPTILLILALAFIIPGLASGTEFVALSGSADCAGWNCNATVLWGDGVYFGDLDYAVRLLDATGQEVAFQGWSGTFYREMNPQLSYLFSGAWDQELCGDFTVEATFHVVGSDEEDTMVFTSAFFCDCGTIPDPPEDPHHCYLGLGYWKNHEDAWPVDSLELGGESYTQEALLRILRRRVRRNASIRLARQLITAKLNVASGAENTVAAAIEAGDAYLAMHPFYRHLGCRENRMEARQIMAVLGEFNKQGCDEVSDRDTHGFDMGKAFEAEGLSWGGLKAQYR